MRQVPTISSAIERLPWIDSLSKPVREVTYRAFAGKAGQSVKNWLHGTPIRHRVHPALIVWPLGAWTTAELLDLLDGLSPDRDFGAAADAAVAAGVVGTLPTAAAGLADWVDLEGHRQRVGMAHATLNTIALALYTASLGLRWADRRGPAVALAGIGYGAVLLSGTLGGELTYNLAVNVPHYLDAEPSTGWADVLAAADLPEGRPVVVEVDHLPVLLLRRGGRIFAVEDWCPHSGGALSRGRIEGEVIECPRCRSRFNLDNGRPVQGPASVPLHTFEVREQGGRIALRPSYEGHNPELSSAAHQPETYTAAISA